MITLLVQIGETEAEIEGHNQQGMQRDRGPA